MNPIDRFILANLEKNGLQPAPPAGKNDAAAPRHLRSDRPAAHRKGDRAIFSPTSRPMLSRRWWIVCSPRRAMASSWGRHWLDVMRYADSTGSDEDHRYPHAWRYRDYVIQAFNDDMPYNQFVREQLAGDILAADPKSASRIPRHRRHRLSRARQEGARAKGSAAEAL